MNSPYKKVHPQFKLNGQHYSASELKEVSYSFIKEGAPFEKVIGDFLGNWLHPNDFIIIQTSGSTGQPKRIKIMKEAMVNSAMATGEFFNLQPGDKALGCLPCDYIAGKMMLVRAMVLGLEIDLLEPTSKPKIIPSKTYDFCAMVPLQLQNSIAKTDQLKTIIVGGSKVSRPLEKLLRESNSIIYETYGMTETVTHVAVKQLQTKVGKADDYFKALPNVTFSQDDRNCLVITAPKLNREKLNTNDVVDLISPTQFKLLGRYDNVINSGGVKLFPEQIETKLQAHIKSRFFVSAQPDETLGEQLILIVENSEENFETLLKTLQKSKSLKKFEIPKRIYSIDKFIETKSGKIQRNKTVAAVLGR